MHFQMYAHNTIPLATVGTNSSALYMPHRRARYHGAASLHAIVSFLLDEGQSLLKCVSLWRASQELHSPRGRAALVSCA